MQALRKLLSSKLPMSIEAPPIRSIDDINNVVKLFSEYHLEKFFRILNFPSSPLGKPSSDPGIPAYILKRRLGIHPIIHLPYKVETKYSLLSKLIEYSIAEIEGILVLSGDVKIGALELKDVTEYVYSIRNGVIEIEDKRLDIPNWDFVLGVALIPSRKQEVDSIIYKMSMGIEFFQTQIIISHNEIIGILEDLEERIEKKIPVLVGFAPYLLYTPKLTARILGESASKINSLSEEKYIDMIEEIAKELIELSEKSTTVNLGIHIYPLKWTEKSMELSLEFVDRL